MREFLGAALVINGIVFGIYLLREKTVDWKGFLAVTAVCVLAGVVVANLPNITHLAISGGKGQSVTVEMQRQVETVTAKAEEVKALADKVEGLANKIEQTNNEINHSKEVVSKLAQDADTTKKEIEALSQKTTTSATAVKTMEANVSTMRNDVQQAFRSIFEANAYAIGTRNLFPPPPQIGQEIDKQLNILATFAYPDQKERAATIQRLMLSITNAQPNLPPRP